MMTTVKAVGAVVLAVAMLVLGTLAASAQDDMVMRGWIKSDASQFILVTEMDAGDASSARLMYRMMTDSDMIEDQLDIRIHATEELPKRDARNLGVEEATIYDIDFDRTMPGVMIVTYEGSSIYILMLVGVDNSADLDEDTFGEVTEEVISLGVDRATSPVGWIEQDMSDL